MNLFRRRPKGFYLALRKFHCSSSLLRSETASLGIIMSNDRFCDRKNFSSTLLLKSGLHVPTLAKTRSGLAPVFRRLERKLAGPCRSKSGMIKLLVPHSVKIPSFAKLALYPHFSCRQLKTPEQRLDKSNTGI